MSEKSVRTEEEIAAGRRAVAMFLHSVYTSPPLPCLWCKGQGERLPDGRSTDVHTEDCVSANARRRLDEYRACTQG
jgi:hypothetical protein